MVANKSIIIHLFAFFMISFYFSYIEAFIPIRLIELKVESELVISVCYQVFVIGYLILNCLYGKIRKWVDNDNCIQLIGLIGTSISVILLGVPIFHQHQIL